MCEKKLIRGFTLLELLVVLAIVGIMSAMVLPRLAGSLGNLTQKTAARKVSAALRFARSQAVSEGTMLVAFVDKERGILVIGEDPDFNGENDTTETVDDDKQETQRLLYELPEGVFFDKADNSIGDWDKDAFKILFFPTGRSSGGQFYLTRPDRNPFVVSVDQITGAVSIMG